MQTLNGDKHIHANKPVWYLFAEFPLSETSSVDSKTEEFTAGFLAQSFRKLGIQPEQIERIEMTLAAFVKEELMHYTLARSELPGRIRVFCQKKVSDDANSAKTSRPDNTEHTSEQAPILYHSGTTMGGGWGYFILGRSGHSTGYSERSHPIVEIYLYKEGE